MANSWRITHDITPVPSFLYLFTCSHHSLKLIDIPNSVKTIGWLTFDGCSSLRSINMPIGVKKIERYAFGYCKLLQSIHIPNTVETVENRAFYGCDTLEDRLESGANYHWDTETWLRQRFDNLPIHEACYYANDDTQSAVDHLSTIVQQNKQVLAATDAMGMTPLHILCCNPHITAEMVRVIVEQGEPSLLIETDVTGNTPLQLFMRCRGYLPVDADEGVESMPSLNDLLKMGISGEDLAVLIVLNENQEFRTCLYSKDDSTNLFPFMTAASLSSCGLDVVYTLAMKNLNAIVWIMD